MLVPRIDAYVVRQGVGQDSLQQQLLLALPVPVHKRHRLQVVLRWYERMVVVLVVLMVLK